MSDDKTVFDFDEAVKGKELSFYGVCETEFKLGDTVWCAVEDPDDGYRSMLETVEKRDSTAVFCREPIATVRVEEYDTGREHSWDTDEGYQLVDVADGHIWLRFGTDNYDGWYPMFVFEYTPRSHEAEGEGDESRMH